MDKQNLALIALVTAAVVIACYFYMKHNKPPHPTPTKKMTNMNYPMLSSSEYPIDSPDTDFNPSNLMPRLSVSGTEGGGVQLQRGEILRSIRPTVQSYYGLYPDTHYKDLAFVV